MAERGWRMADGRWQMADGRWQMVDGRRLKAICLPSAICHPPLEVHAERDAELARRVRRGVSSLLRAVQQQAVDSRDVWIVLELQGRVQGRELRRVEDVIELQLQPR